MNIKKRQGQVWSIDFIIGTAIFLLSLILFYVFITNLFAAQGGKVTSLMTASETVSNSLVSEGLPLGWNAGNVKRIGLTNGKQDLNTTKLESFFQIAENNYGLSRALLSTEYDYYIFFLDKEGNITAIGSVYGVGKAGVNATNIHEIEDPAKLVKVYRLVRYNNTIMRMGVYLWQK